MGCSFWVGLKSVKAENATALDQFESNWSEKMSACRATAAQGGQQITACTNFPKNPPRALQDGVGLVGIHTLYSYFWVDLKVIQG